MKKIIAYELFFRSGEAKSAEDPPWLTLSSSILSPEPDTLWAAALIILLLT